MDILTEQVKEFTPNAVLLNPLQDRSIVKNIQAEGKSAFDEMDNLTAWDLLNKNMLQYELLSLYKQMGFEVSDEELNKYKVDEPEQKATKAKKSTKKSTKTTKTTKKSKKE